MVGVAFSRTHLDKTGKDGFRIKGWVERVISGAWYVWMLKDIQEDMPDVSKREKSGHRHQILNKPR